MVTLLNQFAILVSENIKTAVAKIINCDDRNPGSRKISIEKILNTDLDVDKWKKSFISRNNHPRKSIYKCLGDNYLDHVKVRYENFRLATNVYVDILPNKFQEKSSEIKKTITMK